MGQKQSCPDPSFFTQLASSEKIPMQLPRVQALPSPSSQVCPAAVQAANERLAVPTMQQESMTTATARARRSEPGERPLS